MALKPCPWKLVSHPLSSQSILVGGAELWGLVLGHTQTQIDCPGGWVDIFVAMVFTAGCGGCWKVTGVGVRCNGLVRVARGERVTLSHPSARYPLASGGAVSLSPSESVQSCRLCSGSWFSLQVNSSALRQRAGGAGASLCSPPVLVHPPPMAKSPLKCASQMDGAE